MIGGYANAWRSSGEHSRDVEPDEYCGSVTEWLSLQEGQEETAGRRTFVVGGCCGIFPEHISEMREVVDARE
jgi:S-methylmethionine-dependent homocysteine/selenocysteine methylase